MQNRWERLTDTSCNGVEVSSARIKVPGGWIYRSVVYTAGFGADKDVAVTQTFVPEAPE